jgi:hypothetical protein
MIRSSEHHEDLYRGTEVDTLFALTKKELICEVLLLRREHHDADIRALRFEQQFLELNAAYTRLTERNEKRYDELLDQQNRILAQRLGTADRPVGEGATQPISIRKAPWRDVKASFEAKDRQEYWRARVEQVEGQKAASMNDSETKQDLEELNK